MMAAKRVIAVVGMHRSGTSAMTRALGYLGAGLGDTFIETLPEVNAKGFWEDADINRINIALMRHFGCDWLSHRSIAPERFAEPGLQRFADQAAQVLRQRLQDMDVFAFKDPRTSLLLPFWQAVFAQAGIAADYLIAIRHPDAVAASLARRNGFETAKSLNLWLHYTAEALQKSVPARRRVLVDYDLLMDDPVGSLRRIAHRLDLPAPQANAEEEFSGSFLSAELRHCRPASACADNLAQSFYADLLPAACDKVSLDSATVKAALARASKHLEDCALLLAYLDQVEYAAALGGGAHEAQFPWLRTLRASFGVVEPPPVTASPEYRPPRLRAMLDRLVRRRA